MSKLILIVEDDMEIGNAVEQLLLGQGYLVKRAYSGTEAMLILDKISPDLILLDLMLPGINGEELVGKVEDIPIIIVSAKCDIDDKVKLLLGGAVDYITKPFNSKELLARIAVWLRRPNMKCQQIVYNDIVMNLEEFKVYVNDCEIKLTKTEYGILKILMSQPDRVFSKAQILDGITENTLDGEESSISTHISNLRNKLRGATKNDYIEAVWGIGYRMKKS